MSNCSDNKNPLQHSGTSQAERLLPGLQAGYVKVNEKEYADWIVFAGEFASYLTYYDASGHAAGNWQPFFTNDVSALLGTIAVQDINAYRRMIKDRFDFIKSHHADADLVNAEQKLHELFSILLSLSKALDRYLSILPGRDDEQGLSISLKTTLKNYIETKLAPALQRLLAYYKAAVTATFLQPGDLTGLKVINMPVVPAASIIDGEGLSESWWRNGATSWSNYMLGITPDAGIFGNAGFTPIRHINHAAHHNLFTSIFDQYIQVYTKIINDATADLLTTLQNWNTHPAHYALFLAFLKLFRLAQDNINTITQRHLDLYYKEVLQLLPKKAVPNKTHILVELAKMTDEYALKQGALLKAGKDSAGKEVLYALDKETTFNKAKVAQLKSVYRGATSGDDNPPAGTTNNKDRLFASPVINSDDGLGAALTSPNKEWHPYVNRKYEEAQLKEIAMPKAAIGFAIASHYLYCAEGERKITVRLAASNNTQLYNQPFDCYLTTEKAWLKIDAPGLSSITSGTMTNSTPCAEFTISLGGDAPAITNYVKAVHGGTFDATTPILRMVLQNVDEASYPYKNLQDITISHVEINVQVGDISDYSNTGLKQLLLSNDFGPIDPSKPFQPFGSLPAVGNRLVIGCREVFTKKKTRVRFNIEWKDIGSVTYGTISYGYEPDGGKMPNANIRYLKNGIWENWASEEEIFSSNSDDSMNPKITVPYSSTDLSDDTIVPYDQDYGLYGINSIKGYAAIQLTQNFGHKAYQDALTAYLIDQSKPSPTLTKPPEPYTPVIQSLYLSYTAYCNEEVNSTEASDFESREIRFYHIYPFGEGEQRGTISNGTVPLLPQFNHTSDSAVVDHIGEFYIGIEQLHAQQAVNILFQVMEGTADPEMIKPDDHIHWSYLSSNQWVAFDKKTISDATRQLVQSGIISFVIPANATTDNTILPAGYIWLRAAVSEAAVAVCKLLAINTQAALVTFVPNNNAADFLDKALPAGTVSKLKAPDPSVKKIAQPYSSFGGRPKEKENEFYVRVSERLRHKNRAITIWDYEHLVLENFPQIYRAKCLNHTRLEENLAGNTLDYNEVAPGYVSVITVPNLLNRNDTNPLKPYTNQNTLLEIEEFLKKKISCHVNLRVCNPQFEEVRLKFDLKLLTGYDDFTYYQHLLQQEITQFLTPWAFADGADISFGGKVSKSVLIDFIEERPYVDFITNVEMYQRISNTVPESGDLDEIVASTARSILVSAPASKHVINKITESSSSASTSNCGCGSTTTIHH